MISVFFAISNSCYTQPFDTKKRKRLCPQIQETTQQNSKMQTAVGEIEIIWHFKERPAMYTKCEYCAFIHFTKCVMLCRRRDNFCLRGGNLKDEGLCEACANCLNGGEDYTQHWNEHSAVVQRSLQKN